MLTVRAAAAHADVSESLVRQWLKERRLPHFRLGSQGKRGKILIAVEDLDSLIAAAKVGNLVPVKAPAPKSVMPKLKHLRLPSA